MSESKDGLLRWIAVFKFFKAASLIAAGIGVFKLMHNDVGQTLDHWVRMLGLDPGNRHLEHALRSAANLPPNKMRDVALGSFIYAGLFLTEGIGLWLRKRWGEWFTVIITTSLVPLEVYELIHHPTAIKGIVLLINVAVVVYLVVRIRREGKGKGQEARE